MYSALCGETLVKCEAMCVYMRVWCVSPRNTRKRVRIKGNKPIKRTRTNFEEEREVKRCAGLLYSRLPRFESVNASALMKRSLCFLFLRATVLQPHPFLLLFEVA